MQITNWGKEVLRAEPEYKTTAFEVAPAEPVREGLSKSDVVASELRRLKGGRAPRPGMWSASAIGVLAVHAMQVTFRAQAATA